MNSLSVSLVILGLLLPPAQGGNWKADLKLRLEASYNPTILARKLMARTGPIEKPGIVMVIQKAGIRGGTSNLRVRISTVKNGVLTRVFQEASAGEYLYKIGDRVYVQSVDVDDSVITFRLFTVEPVTWSNQGSTQVDRFQADLRFEFAKGFLPTASVPAIQKTIGEFLLTEEMAASANTKTISYGQTMAEVEKILGKPDTVINLGARVTYVYKNMKIVFTDGKVTDVQ